MNKLTTLALTILLAIAMAPGAILANQAMGQAEAAALVVQEVCAQPGVIHVTIEGIEYKCEDVNVLEE